MALAVETLRSPLGFLRHMLGTLPNEPVLREYQSWWETEGSGISEATDRAGTPWLRMYDRAGQRVDEILLPLNTGGRCARDTRPAWCGALLRKSRC